MSRLFLAVVVNLCSGPRSKAIKWERSCRNDKPQGVKIQQSGSVLGGGGGGGDGGRVEGGGVWLRLFMLLLF